jgi:integrase
MRRVPRFITADQVDELAALVPDRYRALIYVLAYGGLRWAEAVGLELEHVSLLLRRIVVAETLSEVNGRLDPVAPKTWKSRTVAIPPFCRRHTRRAHREVPGRQRRRSGVQDRRRYTAALIQLPPLGVEPGDGPAG